MTQLPCPKCGAVAFVWSHDPDRTPATTWDCVICRYRAFEDESLETGCAKCGTERFGCSILEDSNGRYRWCGRCGVLGPADAAV